MARRNSSNGGGCGFLFLFLFILFFVVLPRMHRSSYDSYSGTGYSYASSSHQSSYATGADSESDWWKNAGNRGRIDLLIDTLENGETESMLLYERRESGSIRAVWITENGLRVTVDWDGEMLLTFWVRKNGTYGKDTLMKFTDQGLMGAPNFGMKYDEDPDAGSTYFYDRDSGQHESNYYSWRDMEDAVLADAEENL